MIEVIWQWFLPVSKSQVKIFAELTQKPTENNYQLLILPRTAFLTEHSDVTTLDLWCHANVWYWYYDVLFVDCSCTHKLAQIDLH